MAEVEETLKKLQAMKGVEGLLILNLEGIPIKSSMSDEKTRDMAYTVHNLVEMASSCLRDMEPGNDLTFLRLRTKTDEIMCAVNSEHRYVMVVVQKGDSSKLESQ